MPNRIIKESICTSDTIDCLSDFEEVVFYRLIVNCDDFGRFDARAKVLSSKLFPLKSVSVERMQAAINSLCNAGLITVYVVDNRPYLQMKTWSKHQSTRAKKSKYPEPNENTCMQMQADENNSTQMSPYSLYENRESIYENRESLSLYDTCACAREGTSGTGEETNNDDNFENLPNAFADTEPDHPGPETLETYAANNIVNMNGGNMPKLMGYRDILGEPLVRYGIDMANKYCKTGVPTYAYLDTILKGFVARKIKTVEQAEMAENARQAEKARSSPKSNAARESDDFWSRIPFSS